MSDGMDSDKDDRLTVVAISALACVLQDVLHEGLGHGVTAWLSGARRLAISTVALQSDIATRWISANGTLVNLLFGAIFWLLLLRPQRYRPAMRYFLVLAMAGNLFTGTGYFLFSGVFNFGDWAAVIQGAEPHWMWQLGLVLVGLASYYASMRVVAAKLKPFRGPHDVARERQRGGASWASAAERCVDRYGCRRQPAVYLGAWTRAHVVAIVLDCLSTDRKADVDSNTWPARSPGEIRQAPGFQEMQRLVNKLLPASGSRLSRLKKSRKLSYLPIIRANDLV